MKKIEIKRISKLQVSIRKHLHLEFNQFDGYFRKLRCEVDAPSQKSLQPKFDAILISTEGFKFDRDEANAR